MDHSWKVAANVYCVGSQGHGAPACRCYVGLLLRDNRRRPPGAPRHLASSHSSLVGRLQVRHRRCTQDHTQALRMAPETQSEERTSNLSLTPTSSNLAGWSEIKRRTHNLAAIWHGSKKSQAIWQQSDRIWLLPCMRVGLTRSAVLKLRQVVRSPRRDSDLRCHRTSILSARDRVRDLVIWRC